MTKRSFLSLYALLLLTFIFLPAAAAAKEDWLHVKSKNFNLVGNASEKDIRKVGTKLEQFRETFRQLFTQSNLNSPIPTNVVVFKNSGAYKPFKPKRADGKIDNFVAGYFQPGEDVNYITLSVDGSDADLYGLIFHEYVHFIVNTNYGKSDVPPWFNEGLAEYYQTFAIEEDRRVKLGLPQSGHLQLLRQTKLIPLDTLFGISNYALHQNGNHSRSIFYAQSWALVHYLIQSGKAEGLGKFLNLLMSDTPSEKAFNDSFGMTYGEMEKELRRYVGQGTYKYQEVSFKNKLVFDAEMQASPLSEADSNAYLGDLLYHTNRADDAEEFLQKALALKPDSSMANTSYGMVKMRQRKFDEAKGFLEKALAGDSKNHLALYRYAYLLSRENRDEFGYVSQFSDETAIRMRELLKKAIGLNPAFTESYELLAFINLVKNEQLDESIAYLRRALQYQPGNQRYQIRIAELYMRQEKFAEALAISEKISKTADEPDVKNQADNLTGRIRRMQEIYASNENARRQYEEARKSGGGNAAPPTLGRRSPEKMPSPEEIAKARENAELRFINGELKKKQAGETQVIGRIEKIECKNGAVAYAVKTAEGTITLSTKDFENLSLNSLVASAGNIQIDCGVSLAAYNSVVTYKPAAPGAKTASRGELTGIDFVPENFRFVDLAEEPPSRTFVIEEAPKPADAEDYEAQRRAAMLQAIRGQIRAPQAGEKRAIGFIEKIECGSKGTVFHLKTPSETLKLSVSSLRALQIRGFTPDIEQIQFGCGLKQVDVPAVFIYKEVINLKAGAEGELVSMDFVPKSFTLED